MDLYLNWLRPITLRKGKPSEKLIYTCDLQQLPAEPGIYVFCRAHGKLLEPLYIGKSGNIRLRINQHFKHSVSLMKGILDHDKTGKRVVVPGCWLSQSGQQQGKALPLIERALIRYALAEGYDLLNKSGTRIPSHSLDMSGNQQAMRVFPRDMLIDK